MVKAKIHRLPKDDWKLKSATISKEGDGTMKDLSIRTMKCDCGLVISRDQNAAINIKNEGLRILKEA